jgi:4-hydroxyphenylpyruvate dioxygenase
MQTTQLTINSITTRQADLPEALSAYAAAGFPNVELHLPLVRAWLDAGHTTGDTRDLIASHNLYCIGGFHLPVECFSTQLSQRTNHAITLRNARILHDLGGGTLVVGTDGPVNPSLADLELVASTFANLLQQMDGLDVTLAIEFNWGPLVKSLASAVRVCEMANHPRLGVLFDPAHYYTTTTKFDDLTAENVRWIRHVHMDDMADKPADLSNCNADRVLPGAGILDLGSLIGKLEAHGYDGFFAIEMFSEELWALTAAEAADQCYQSLLSFCS